ncbi:ABC transporter permease [Acidobacteriota bacterium]
MFVNKLKSFYSLFRLCLKLTFSRRFLFFVIGTLTWFALRIGWSYQQQSQGNEPMDVTDVLNGVLALPGIILVVIMSMQTVTFERDNRTLEVLYCMPGSRFSIWIIKMLTLYLAVFIDMLLLAGLSYLFVADFNVVAMAFHAMFPLLVFGAMTLLFSLIFKSGNAAGMLAIIVIIITIITAGGWYRSPYFPFINPFNPPSDIDPWEWFTLVLQNRILMVGIASVLIFISLRLLDSRERLL